MVASYTQLLAKRYKGKLDSDADEFISFAVDGASRMQRLIQDLLVYSRVGTKAQELLETSSEEALQQALINLRGAIEESGALVTHDRLPTIPADEVQLDSAFPESHRKRHQVPRARYSPRTHLGDPKTARRNGYFRYKTTAWELTRSTSKRFSVCSSGFTNAKSSPARA